MNKHSQKSSIAIERTICNQLVAQYKVDYSYYLYFRIGNQNYAWDIQIPRQIKI